jgi:hypothetical protein
MKYLRALPLLAIFFLSMSALQAQDTEPSGRRQRHHDRPENREEHHRKLAFRHEVGINATSLLDKVFRATPDSANANPFLLTYRLGYKKWGLRAGAGGTYRQTNNVQEGFRDSDIKTTQAWNTRLGVDYRFKFGRRFSGGLGLDGVMLFSQTEQITDSGFDVIERIQQSQLWGGGPSFNLAFWITPKVGLLTEANFYYLSGSTDSARRFKNFPELNDQLITTEVRELRTLLPSSIFLVLKF